MYDNSIHIFKNPYKFLLEFHDRNTNTKHLISYNCIQQLNLFLSGLISLHVLSIPFSVTKKSIILIAF